MAAIDSAFLGKEGFQNDGDNEITGIHVSDGNPTVEGLIASIGLPPERPRIVTRNGGAVTPDAILAEGDKVAVSPIYSGG